MSTLHQINRKAHSILARELGPVDYILFFRQFENGSGDYTQDRWQWLEGESIDSIAAEARRMENAEAGGMPPERVA